MLFVKLAEAFGLDTACEAAYVVGEVVVKELIRSNSDKEVFSDSSCLQGIIPC